MQCITTRPWAHEAPRGSLALRCWKTPSSVTKVHPGKCRLSPAGTFWPASAVCSPGGIMHISSGRGRAQALREVTGHCTWLLQCTRSQKGPPCAREKHAQRPASRRGNEAPPYRCPACQRHSSDARWSGQVSEDKTRTATTPWTCQARGRTPWLVRPERSTPGTHGTELYKKPDWGRSSRHGRVAI